jgi:hypothetical protein
VLAKPDRLARSCSRDRSAPRRRARARWSASATR